MSGNLLVVEDDAALRRVVVTALKGAGYQVSQASGVEEAEQALAAEPGPDAVIVDIGLADGSGLDLLEVCDQIPVIVVTARTTMDNAIAAMRGGAFEYLTKPFDLDLLEEVVGRAVAESRQLVSPEVPVDDGEDNVLVGRSAVMQRVFKAIGRAAGRSAPVLIEGESGTGKELAARSVHRYSGRGGAFIAVNVAALPTSLVESELFGHEQGAFTGADVARPGLLRAADGGTLFLDEIGEMSLAVQAKLLRVLEEGVVTPVGAVEPIPVSVRLISATHRDLALEVAAERFRSDLYYRLNVLPIVLPPLRQRRQDIPELVLHLLARMAREQGQPAPSVSGEALDLLRNQPWPGNVRELRNVLLRGLTFCTGRVLEAHHLGLVTAPDLQDPVRDLVSATFEGDGPEPSSLLLEVEEELIRQALVAEGGSRSRAAARLGMHRNTLRRRMKELGVGDPE